MNRALLWSGPVILFVAVATAFFAMDPLRPFMTPTPPVELLTFERAVLDRDGIGLVVRADGSEPVRIAQVLVDGAYWTFSQTPPGPIRRLTSVRLAIPYPWVPGETHEVTVLTTSGATFEYLIEVAVATPALSSRNLAAYSVVGLFVGLVPVVIGMLFFPALRRSGRGTFTFALALTVGLMAFLLVDTMAEALELAARAAPGLQPVTMVWLVAGLTFAALMAITHRSGRVLAGLPLAAAIAFGIGLHNFGEGLAIGSAFATGAAALGTFLVLGFTLHNITEGIGIVAPVLAKRPSLLAFAGLAGLAGLPVVPGIWLGSTAVASHWGAVALAVGTGAILQVIVSVGRLLVAESRLEEASRVARPALLGIGTGAGVMYATALLVQV